VTGKTAGSTGQRNALKGYPPAGRHLHYPESPGASTVQLGDRPWRSPASAANANGRVHFYDGGKHEAACGCRLVTPVSEADFRVSRRGTGLA
jgi:hypothetical protein